jgi:hypothetical protein
MLPAVTHQRTIGAVHAMAGTPTRIFSPPRGRWRRRSSICETCPASANEPRIIALRPLRQPDAFPAADVGLLRAKEGERPTPKSLLRRAEA